MAETNIVRFESLIKRYFLETSFDEKRKLCDRLESLIASLTHEEKFDVMKKYRKDDKVDYILERVLDDIWQNVARNEISKYETDKLATRRDIISFLLENPPKGSAETYTFIKRALKLFLYVMLPADPDPEWLLPMPTNIRHSKNASLGRLHEKLVREALTRSPDCKRKFSSLLNTMKKEIDESWMIYDAV